MRKLLAIFILLLGARLDCSAATAFVQGGINIVFSGSSVTKALTMTSGSCVAVGVYWAGAGVTLDTITDSKSQTYAIPQNNKGTSPNFAAIGYTYNVAAGSTTVSANFSGAITEAKIWLIEISGCATATDPYGTGESSFVQDSFRNTTTTDLPAATAIVTTVNGSFIVGLAANSSNPAYNAGTGYTKPAFNNDARGDMIYLENQTTAGSTVVTWSRTDTTGATARVFAIAFQPPAGAAASNRGGALLLMN